jgi:iron complex outermembrane receptor protein
MFNDNGSTNQAVAIAPFNVTDVYLNYTFRNGTRFQATRLSLAFNNMFNNLNIVGVTPASTKTSVAAPGDILQLLPGRSVSFTVTLGLQQK